MTIPYKETILPALDVLDPIAKTIGAVNTDRETGRSSLWIQYRCLRACLRPWRITLSTSREKLLSSSAPAAPRNARITSFVNSARRRSSASRARSVKDGDLQFDQIDQCANAKSIVINATPIGMQSQRRRPNRRFH
ncbi:MAG: hypothetical protein MZU97_21330 [Bacillus subtilis]|nr:hypothetical protein [Bacillus subtilis]